MRCIYLLLFLFLVIFLSEANGEIIVYDDVGVIGNPLMLKVKTYGGIFRKGGVSFSFFVNSSFYGRGLSGGDGYGYMEFLPQISGHYSIKVISRSGSDTGNLLILKKGEGIFIIDIDEIKENPFSTRLRKGTKKGISLIKRRYPVVFIYRGDINSRVKKWLRDNEFSDIPLLSFSGEEIFEDIFKKGLRIAGLLGTPDIIDQARRFEIKIYTFDDVEDEDIESLEDWNDLIRRIR